MRVAKPKNLVVAVIITGSWIAGRFARIGAELDKAKGQGCPRKCGTGQAVWFVNARANEGVDVTRQASGGFPGACADS